MLAPSVSASITSTGGIRTAIGQGRDTISLRRKPRRGPQQRMPKRFTKQSFVAGCRQTHAEGVHESRRNGDFVSRPRLKSHSKKRCNPRYSQAPNEYRTKGRRIPTRAVRIMRYRRAANDCEASQVRQHVSER